MAAPKKPVNKELFKEFIDSWNSKQGLVPQYIVADIFGVGNSQISKHWQEMELEKITVNGKPFITYASMYNAVKNREKTTKPTHAKSDKNITFS